MVTIDRGTAAFHAYRNPLLLAGLTCEIPIDYLDEICKSISDLIAVIAET
jgi:hypothetical protein